MFVHSVVRLLDRSVVCLFVRSVVHPFVRLFDRWFVHSLFVWWFVCSSVHLVVGSFVRSFFHLVVCLFVCLSWYARRTLCSRVRSFDSAIVNSAARIACANDSPGDTNFRPTATPMRLSLHTLVADMMINNWHVCCLGLKCVKLRAIGLLHPPFRIFGGRGNTKSSAVAKNWGCCLHWSIQLALCTIFPSFIALVQKYLFVP